MYLKNVQRCDLSIYMCEHKIQCECKLKRKINNKKTQTNYLKYQTLFTHHTKTSSHFDTR